MRFCSAGLWLFPSAVPAAEGLVPPTGLEYGQPDDAHRGGVLPCPHRLHRPPEQLLVPAPQPAAHPGRLRAPRPPHLQPHLLRAGHRHVEERVLHIRQGGRLPRTPQFPLLFLR